MPGVLGYFQVDAAGRLTTPLLPDAGVAAASYGIAPAEEAARRQRVEELRELLARNELVRAPRDEAPARVRPLLLPAPARESAPLERERRQLSRRGRPGRRRSVGAVRASRVRPPRGSGGARANGRAGLAGR